MNKAVLFFAIFCAARVAVANTAAFSDNEGRNANVTLNINKAVVIFAFSESGEVLNFQVTANDFPRSGDKVSYIFYCHRGKAYHASYNFQSVSDFWGQVFERNENPAMFLAAERFMKMAVAKYKLAELARREMKKMRKEFLRTEAERKAKEAEAMKKRPQPADILLKLLK